ncbi:MAB_1171c family putative transporter [Streptomyces sp. SS162]|uniref:MAB_1171c family putative transporter n=1 Tax=Streptomyces sp. SS162 TaxID=3108484 RepID=UPI002F4017C8
MTSDLPGNLGRVLQTAGVLLLWAAVLLRARPAARHPGQRGLWLAVACAAAALTLHLEAVSAYAAALTGSPRAVGLVKNQAGIVSAGAILHFAVHTTGSRRRTGAVLATTVAVMAALLALAGLGSPHAPGHGPYPTLACPRCAAYWLLLVTVHVAACALCARVCWRYGRSGPHRSVNLGLTLLGWGSASAGLYWLAHYYLMAVEGRPGGVLRLVLSAHAVLCAAVLMVPTALQLRRAAGHARTVWRIWPLWRDLVEAVPHVALAGTRCRPLTLLRPQLPWRQLAYRKVIEVRDALLVLSHYTDPAVSRAARAHVARWGIPAERADAHVTACVLRGARAARLAGADPDPAAEVLAADREACGLAAETAVLLRLTEAYLSPCARAFDPAGTSGTGPAGDAGRTGSAGAPPPRTRMSETPTGPDERRGTASPPLP